MGQVSKHLKDWRSRFTCRCGKQAESILILDSKYKIPFCGSNECESKWASYLSGWDKERTEKMILLAEADYRKQRAFDEERYEGACKRAIEASLERDEARAEADRLRGTWEALKHWLVKQIHAPRDRVVDAAGTDILKEIDQLELNPPEVIRAIVEDYQPDPDIRVTQFIDITRKAKDGDEVLVVKLSKEGE